MTRLRTHGSYLLPLVALLVSAGSISFEYSRRDAALKEIAATKLKFNEAEIQHKAAVTRYKLSMRQKQSGLSVKHP